MMWNAIPPLRDGRIVEAHGGILTGHWEFDLALLLTLLAVVAYSFLLPADAPRGVGRLLIQSVSFLFFAGALILAVLGFRSL
ncbi:MAG TPA: hypothetical protein VFD70_08605 [Anaerolineae bacterium]|nr:hypothetical protein [Anaerolineae bacterium]